MDATPSPRRPWVAVLLGLLCAGLGHAYAGRAAAGIGLYLARLALLLVALAGLRAGARAATLATAAALVFSIWQAVLAGRAARQEASSPRRWYSRPLGVAVLLAAALAVESVREAVLVHFSPRAFSMPSGSMTPTVQPGDYFVAVPGGRLERGDVVVHEAPPAAPHRDPLIKRVVALGGDTVELRDGALWVNGEPVPREQIPGPCTYWNKPEGHPWREEPCVDFVERLGAHAYHTYCTPSLPCGDVPALKVPPGAVFVVGDHRDRSADSRVYGPIPEGAIIGRAAYVYFSSGPSGIRWDRTGSDVR